MIRSEISSSLVTSYNSDDREDELRVSKLRKTRKKESNTKRSMTSPSSFTNAARKNCMSWSRIHTEQAHDKSKEMSSKKDRDNLKRQNSSQGEHAKASPIIFLDSCNVINSNINSSHQLTEKSSKKTLAEFK